MKFLLDTNVVAGLLRGNSRVLARVHRHTPLDLCISVVVMHELLFGAYKGTRQASNLAAVDALRFAVLDFTKDDARQAAEIRAVLMAAGRPIGMLDMLIAGQARARNLVLVTHNTSEFQPVDGLQVEDWGSPS